MKVSPWVLVFLGAMTEIVWAIAMDYSEGFTIIQYDIIVIVFLVTGMILFNIAAREIPIGTAYAVWVGMGAIGTIVVSVLMNLEPVDPLNFIFAALIILGIVGLKVTSEKKE